MRVRWWGCSTVEQGSRAGAKLESWKVNLASVASGDSGEVLQNKDTKEVPLK